VRSLEGGRHSGRGLSLASKDIELIKTKSVYSPIDPKNDGLRILVTRFHGRGLRKTRYDVWMANLGPSEALLREFWSGDTTWHEFARRYRKELWEPGGVDGRNKTIKNHGQKFTLRLLQELGRRGRLTLLCHCGEDCPASAPMRQNWRIEDGRISGSS
jgi:uncharacterized protein YeaO (DUF488 family)